MNKMDKAMEQKNADRPVALKVEHVSKNFKLPVERAGSLKNMLFNWLRGIRGYRTQEVLKDITFDIKQGEFFGIVGKNGSGKSTLLKLISQIIRRIQAQSKRTANSCRSLNWALDLTPS